MRKIFLTSGLVLCMVGSNAFAATDIDANGNVGGSAATCVYNVLDTYEGSSSFDAKWTPNNYTISFAENTVDTNGTELYGTPAGSMSQQTYAYDSTANLTSNAYSLTGYSFDGWSTTTNPANVNGGNATLTNAQSVTYTYPGNSTLTARWDPVKSGAITLVSNVYPNNDTSQTPLYTTSTSEAVTPPTTSTVYSVYNNGLYSDSACTTPVVVANLIPSKTGYTFGGYKNAAGTTLYINSSGAVQGAGLRAVTTDNGTDTWYAQWTPKTKTITYGCGSAPTGASTTVSGSGPSNGSATFDSTYDLSATYGTCALSGYHATGWDCSGGATLSNATGTQSALSTDSDIACNVHWVANNIITNWDGNVGTIGTSGSDSCDYDSGITLPSNVVRPGFVLNGWTVTNSATLPSGYTRLDYLESTGTQYIDTGVTYDETKTITVHVSAQTSYIPSSDMIVLGFVNNGGVWFGVNTSGNWTIGGSVNSNVSASNKTSDIEIMWTGGREYLKIGGISIGNRGSYSNSNTLKLFGRMASGSFTGRIYYAKIFVDGVLVKELIPAKNSSDVLGMYDTVNNEFKTNTGSGTFIAGPPAQ